MEYVISIAHKTPTLWYPEVAQMFSAKSDRDAFEVAKEFITNHPNLHEDSVIRLDKVFSDRFEMLECVPKGLWQ